MNAQIAEQLESMHRMLTKTREDVKGLRLEVSVLHQALSSGEDIPPPAEEKLPPPIEDEMDVLSAKNIRVGTKDLLEILQVSDSTLKKWRKNGDLPFEYLSRNHVSYLLADVFEGIKTGSVTCKGLKKITALERILIYSRSIADLRSME